MTRKVSVRIWQKPHVKAGGPYPLGTGAILDVTPDLARRSGFLGVIGLLKVAKHGPGEKVYLVELDY